MPDRPLINAEVTFLRTDEGGRVQATVFNEPSRYMPHVVIQDRGVRKPVIGTDGVIHEPYQPVAFASGPVDFRLGDTARFLIELMYYPQHPYDDVLPGATFTLREGARIVAHGVVLNRHDPRPSAHRFDEWWSRFSRTGNIAPLELGFTREQVRATLGDPHDTSAAKPGQPRGIWVYGALEFHFGQKDDGTLRLIYMERDGVVEISIRRLVD